MEIVFIRHTSVDVSPGTCYGSSDVPLNSTFPREALEVAKKLDGMSFDRVYSSPLSRAKRLAEFCGFPNPIIEPRVSEVDYGHWEMVSFDSIPLEEIQPWYDNWRYVRPPHGESFHDEYLRVTEFIDQLRRESYQRVAVFCHGGVLICAAIYAGLFQFDEDYTQQFNYGDLLTIHLQNNE